MHQIKKGDIVVFKKDLLSNWDRDIILKAGIAVKVVNISTKKMTVELPNGTTKDLRYIPDRMYLATEVGKVLYV
jgi:hypothetical protein